MNSYPAYLSSPLIPCTTHPVPRPEHYTPSTPAHPATTSDLNGASLDRASQYDKHSEETEGERTNRSARTTVLSRARNRGTALGAAGVAGHGGVDREIYTGLDWTQARQNSEWIRADLEKDFKDLGKIAGDEGWGKLSAREEICWFYPAYMPRFVMSMR